jgi:flagellar biosynthesis repressor protein FlbT
MSCKLRIQLKADERLFVNGGILKVDRKVRIEFLNDVSFLLEAHILEPDMATTPLKRLYFIAQSMLADPGNRSVASETYLMAHRELLMSTRNLDLLEGLCEARRLVECDRPLDALKKIRKLFDLEHPVDASGSALSES